MSSVLRDLEFLSLGTWVGSILYLLGLIAGLMYLAAPMALARSRFSLYLCS